MTVATILAFLGKHWKLFGIGALLLLLAITSARLHHAKADQWDRTACVKGAPCKAVKWKAEVLAMRPALAAEKRDHETCKANLRDVNQSLKVQTNAVEAMQADGNRRAKMLADGLQQARRAAREADARALAILAATPRGMDACAKLFDLDRTINGGSR